MKNFKSANLNVQRSVLGLPRRLFLSALGTGLLFAGRADATTARAGQSNLDNIIQPTPPSKNAFIQRAFEMRQRAIDYGDQAYGAVVVRDDLIIGQSWSRVILDHDPTGHAEMAAIRDASLRLGSRDLSGSILYSSSHPCPMCEAAAYWANIDEMVFGRQSANAGRPKLCG